MIFRKDHMTTLQEHAEREERKKQALADEVAKATARAKWELAYDMYKGKPMTPEQERDHLKKQVEDLGVEIAAHKKFIALLLDRIESLAADKARVGRDD